MVALIQSENHAANKGKTAGTHQFDTHPIGIGLMINQVFLERLIYSVHYGVRLC